MIRELYNNITHCLLYDEKPSIYINKLSDDKELDLYPFYMLEKLKTTEQSPIHHPEGTVWNHTMFVIDYASQEKNKSKNKEVFMWAALLHDIGKPKATKVRKGKITSYDHDKIGSNLASEFLSQLTNDSEFIKQVSYLVKYHMQVLFVLKELPFVDIKSIKLEGDLNELALLGFCDRMGRLKTDRQKEEENIKRFIEICNNYKL